MKKINFKGSIENILKLHYLKDYYTNEHFLANFTDYQEIDGNIYSESSIDEALQNEDIFFCDDCNEYHEGNDYYIIENTNIYVCSDCISSYYQCDDCGCYYERDDVYCDDYGNTICESCYDRNGYITCENCGRITTDYYCDDYECYCDDCYNENHDDLIYDYHDFNAWELFKTQNEIDPKYYVGTEDEIDDGDDNHESAQLVYDNINAVCMYDGSLNNGYEIINHPQTYQYYIEHYDNYKNLFYKLTHEYNYRSHDTNTCGLHFHVTAPKDAKKRDYVVNKMWTILEFYKDEIIKLSRRNESQLHWCDWLLGSDDDENKKALFLKVKDKSKGSRYKAINNTNSKTIEIRLFRGTLNVDTYFACLQFVCNLYDIALDENIDLCDITWDQLIKGNFIEEYCKKHNIFTNRRMTESYKKYYEIQKNIDFYYNESIKRIKKYYEKKLKQLIFKNKIKYNYNDITRFVDIMQSYNKNDEFMKLNNYYNENDYKSVNNLLQCLLSDIDDDYKTQYYISNNQVYQKASNEITNIKNKLYYYTGEMEVITCA